LTFNVQQNYAYVTHTVSHNYLNMITGCFFATSCLTMASNWAGFWDRPSR